MTVIRHMPLKQDLPGVIKLYKQCFAEDPWYERFNDQELITYFTLIEETVDSVCLVAKSEGKIVGLTIGLPLKDKTDVLEIIGNRQAYYLAELCVQNDMRQLGLGKRLIWSLFHSALELGYTKAFARTSVNQPIIVNMFMLRFGFSLITSQSVVSTKFIDGKEKGYPDTRLIMGGQIPHPKIEERIQRGCHAR